VDNISVVRIEEMKKELSSGQFPVRYVKDLGKGHGYMLFNFYGPLPFYVGAVLNDIGINLVGALKRTYFLAFFLGTLFMYLLGKKLYGWWSGVVAAGVYSFTPFLGFDTYYRGGLGEIWAISLVPLTLYFLVNYLTKYSISTLSASSITTALLMLSHNLTAYLTLGVVFCFFLILQKEKKLGYKILLPFIIGLLLSAFFWLPAFIEKNLVWVWYMEKNTSDYQYGFLQYRMLYSPNFLFKMDYLNPWYGLLPLIGLVIVLIRKIRLGTIAKTCFLISAASLFLTMPLSKPIWDNLKPILSILQFPWRFLTIYTVFLPLFIGSLMVGRSKVKYIVGLLIITCSIASSYKSFQPEKYEFVDKYRADDPCGTTWGYEYLPVWTKACLKQYPNSKFDFFEGKGQIESLIDRSRYYELRVKTEENSTLRVNEYFFPGWKASVDGVTTPINYQNLYGIISFPIEKVQHTVVVKFEDTPLRSLSNKVSLLSFMSLVFLLVFSIFKKFIHPKEVIVTK
jgi:hypothetical protein